MSVRMGVVGAGRMGKLHCRVLSEMTGVELVCVVDASPAAAAAVAAQYGAIALNRAEDAVERVDAAIVAVPTSAHVEAARPFVAAGKPVLIEKPLANSSAEGEELIALAERTGSSIQVGQTERFNPAVDAVRRFDIKPKFIEAHRISPFTFRSADIGVVMDMMIHDIDLVLMMVGGEPTDVQAVGVNVLGRHEDIANARMRFPDGCVANLTASRLAVRSERKMRIFSEQAYLSVDYGKKVGAVVKKSENLDLIQMAAQMDAANLAELAMSLDYTKLLKFEQLQVADDVEPLRKQAEAFCRCVADGAEPVVPAAEALADLRCAEAIVAAIKRHRWDGEASDRVGLDIISKDG
ncbi:MAG TPA: Gfo/Idh/MocA family oxidoreductase [Phycisphaerae bacterium]|nr:Gfo/Idh/MocA family oxidoreductase [Phycisphaerae bacterium]